MTSEIELYKNDSVKLNILNELKDGDINISLSFDGGVYQDYISQIHREDGNMRVLGIFKLLESPSDNLLSICPFEIRETLKVAFGYSGKQFEDEKKLSVFRRKIKTVERQYDISGMLSSVEFIPQGNVNYLLRLTYGEQENDEAVVQETSPVSAVSDEAIQPTQTDSAAEISAVEVTAAEQKLKNLRERRESTKDLLKKLEAEYEKDYDEFQRELEEYKQQSGVDQSVIEYYRDNDIQPIEDLMKEINEKLSQAEKQISLVILGRQKKTMEIEKEVKSNKR